MTIHHIQYVNPVPFPSIVLTQNIYNVYKRVIWGNTILC